MIQQTPPLLYSFRRCPYAMRARLALYMCGQTVEFRELVLRNKPIHMVEISPKATVPVLQLSDGQVIDESLDVMLWALFENDPALWLAPQLGTRDQMMTLIRRCENEFKTHLDRYKYANRYEDADPAQHRSQALNFINELNGRLAETPYLFGTRPALADYAIAPFIRQFANTDKEWFTQTPYPALHTWLDWFLKSDPFTAIMEKLKPWQPEDEVMYRF